jgi:hypothetical protein
MRLESTHLTQRFNATLERQSAAAAGGEEVREVDQQALRDSLRVSLSELGQARSAAAQKNRDIDESSLPDTVKQILKMIRELKAQIEAKKVMRDQSLDPDSRRLKVEALQSELAMLQGALSSAQATLVKIMREQGLSGEQMQEVSTLLMK